MANYMGLEDMDARNSKELLKKLDDQGISTPEELKALFNQTSLRLISSQVFSLVLDAGAIAGCASLHTFATTLPQPLRFGLDAVSFGLGATFAFNFLGGVVALGASATAAVLFGANAEAFLEAVKARSEAGGGVEPLAKVRDASKALEIYNTLRELSDTLQESSTTTASGVAAGTYSNLAAFLLVEDAMKTWDPSEFGLTEADAVRVARAFAEYDTDRSGVLEAKELEAILEKLGMKLDGEEDLEYALEALDTNKDGVIQFKEFVAWWAGCPGNLCTAEYDTPASQTAAAEPSS
eukprot:PRCOL_00005411-RA